MQPEHPKQSVSASGGFALLTLRFGYMRDDVRMPQYRGSWWMKTCLEKSTAYVNTG